LLAAQALQAKDDAENALEDLNDPQLQQAQNLKEIADAKKAIDDAERKLANLGLPADKADVDAQRSRVVLARDALEKAEDDYKPYEDKPEDNLQRANYQAKLAAAQKEYDAAVRVLNSLEGTATEIDIILAEADLALANAQLKEAEEESERLDEGPNEADVELLEAQIASAASDYEIYKEGPDPDDVSIAEARLENAKAQLAAAEAQLADLELAAPFNGVVSELNISTSEWVNPGQPVLLIADLDHLQVETTDLGEIDVAQISVGETAIVTFDALPDESITGTVVRIAPKASAGSGVNYTVILEISDVPAALRWGMTAFVDIELDQ
jgi:multidrug efflux pump subunit AcrA (membrane-fusion protein)